MLTCQYYIKKNTNNPRICGKKAAPKNDFKTKCKLCLCTNHFRVIFQQIISRIGHPDVVRFGKDDFKRAQMDSLLQIRKDEFDRMNQEEEDSEVQFIENRNFREAQREVTIDNIKGEINKMVLRSGKTYNTTPEKKGVWV